MADAWRDGVSSHAIQCKRTLFSPGCALEELRPLFVWVFALLYWPACCVCVGEVGCWYAFSKQFIPKPNSNPLSLSVWHVCRGSCRWYGKTPCYFVPLYPCTVDCCSAQEALLHGRWFCSILPLKTCLMMLCWEEEVAFSLWNLPDSMCVWIH